MKYFIFLSLLLCSFLTNASYASCYQAQECHCFCEKITNCGPYAELIGGLNWFNKTCRSKFKTGYYFGGAVGYKFTNNIRLEGEVSYQRSEIDSLKIFKKFHHLSGHLRTTSYMVNLLVDLDFHSPIIPYLGTGIGYAETKGHWRGTSPNFFDFSYETHLSRKGIAWQGIVGVKYHFGNGWEAGIDYRHLLCGEDAENHKLGLALIRYF